MISYADRLRWGMQLVRISQSELARRLKARGVDIKQQSIAHLLTPRARGSSHTTSIARELGLNPDWLATGKGERLAGPLPDGVSRGPSPNHKVSKRGSGLAAEGKNVMATGADTGSESASLPGDAQRSGRAEAGAMAQRPRMSELSETRMVPELDVRAGQGALPADPALLDGSVPLIAEWQVPVDVLRQFTQGPGPGLVFIMAIGDSMEPVIAPNTRVLVNVMDKGPSPPGIYVVFDGFALLIKRVEAIPFSDPPTVRISSANPAYQPYERALDEAHIQGRVVAQMKAT